MFHVGNSSKGPATRIVLYQPLLSISSFLFYAQSLEEHTERKVRGHFAI